MNAEKPISLEGRWDILYRDYPEVYDEFASYPMLPDIIEQLASRFQLAGKIVVDVGSGTGDSTFKLAKFAGSVIGVEIEPDMQSMAIEKARGRWFENIRFCAGDAENLPLASNSVDMAVGFTLANSDVYKSALEMERIVCMGGITLRVDVAQGWYGGELNPIITGQPREEAPVEGSRDEILAGLGYRAEDYFLDQDFHTVEQAVRTYGFIHSQRVIDYLYEHKKSTLRWKFRMRYKIVGS